MSALGQKPTLAADPDARYFGIREPRLAEVFAAQAGRRWQCTRG